MQNAHDDGMTVYKTGSCAPQDQDREFLRSVGVADALAPAPGRITRMYWYCSDPVLHVIALALMAGLSLMSRFVPDDPDTPKKGLSKLE